MEDGTGIRNIHRMFIKMYYFYTMKTFLKKILDAFISFMLGKKYFYGFFYYLYTLAMKGMEHGYKYFWVEASGEINVVKLLLSKKDVIIIDGGANIGQYALMCNRILKEKYRMYSFEPSKKIFDEFLSNTKHIEYIIPINKALSNSCDDVFLYSDGSHTEMASTFPLNYEHFNIFFDQKEKVAATTVDTVMEEFHLQKIHLLKLDLEGAEYIALAGAKEAINAGKIEMIQFEIGRPNVDTKTFFKDFYLLLHDRYNLYRILSFGFTPLPVYSYEYELFLGCNYLAVLKDSDIKIETI